ncbi:hypothetical protein DH2020_004169 [Rehmannia glutinosa]|uniref:MRN complex-interacting protein N-terminal domain-containing protein n=1 Tax=Rehmannia glutinosa TaxID=99300 RepID=A0ABR0XNN0_REHGL
MPTTFIALQCFHCCTMQAIFLCVKQQKKSSNKWSCVVCNEKQSVRKVFAQGAMARDVRKFVQNFNMSRQLSDQKQQLLSEEIETFNSQSDHSRKTKRNDWTEYVDDLEEYSTKFDKDGDIPEGENGLEAIVVTEMPKALFKKPKVKDYSSIENSAGNIFKPMFPDRRNAKRHRNDQPQGNSSAYGNWSFKKSDCYDEEFTSLHSSDRAPKWNRLRAQIQDINRNSANMEELFVRQPSKVVKGSISKWSDYITQEGENSVTVAPMARLDHTTAAKGPVSKWSSFITEEDDDDNLESGRRRGSGDCVSQRSIYPLESSLNDERVEDDIHPDFI